MPRDPLLLALIPLAYVCGSIPFGLLVGLARGIDPRQAGSGNIGATNVGRLLGGKYFAIVFLLDLLKGAAPVLIAGWRLSASAESPLKYLLWIGVGFAAIAGHMFSLFLKFKGGKGVATSAGVLLGIFPYFTWPALVALITFVLIFGLTRYVSVGSMAAACIFPLAYITIGQWLGWPVWGAQAPLLGFAILIALLIVFKHRGNIARLRAGTESRFRRKRSDIAA